MMKWIIGFISLYLLGGALFYFLRTPDVTKEKYQFKTDQALEWNVNDPKNGNYKAPYYIQKPELADKTRDHETDKGKPEIVPNERLMSFFAQAQLGNATDLPTFINYEIAYKDTDNLSPEQIDEKYLDLANKISRGHTIQKVSLSTPKNVSKEHILYDVKIQYKNGTATLENIPMVKMTEARNWFIDLKLSDIAQLLGKKE